MRCMENGWSDHTVQVVLLTPFDHPDTAHFEPVRHEGKTAWTMNQRYASLSSRTGSSDHRRAGDNRRGSRDMTDPIQIETRKRDARDWYSGYVYKCRLFRRALRTGTCIGHCGTTGWPTRNLRPGPSLPRASLPRPSSGCPTASSSTPIRDRRSPTSSELESWCR